MVSTNKEIQNLDYFLVSYQSVTDLIFIGCLGLVDYFLDFWAGLIYLCHYGGFQVTKEDYIRHTNLIDII